MRTLSELKQGSEAEITGINCGKDFSRRLCDLGIFEGTKLTVMKNDNFGPIIIHVLNSKIAIGRGEASKIHAKTLN
ncbi:MAG: hypothetical protein ACD_51C00280G0004 [uncultured bacterium]|nr:MAG: hypothetical protein ACD_51C00280G0004 [uncultured bacterium]OGJ47561.1 MAG: hypothetical protein A2244_00660 [Candidatus Peregrinibacteria bacterium RIFOXYA2_FULL_41_18]OGJ49638.1 MAG: hypothetical protein A2344_02450 [Candidatus Peregrinibacteria bacterium RIFOXYB12_FULL_41_12]OGJ52673.1 MAG: hypothetical protein A2448_02760 [Candidatus Peregrinibacteria bacterium RIFOXYC2_FULL_41_22]OGJ54229.1 MAG: hypothetical protein A2336_02640 [Candidatus Peregrinibacteria bacterium RIFOXYB2_FULL